MANIDLTKVSKELAEQQIMMQEINKNLELFVENYRNTKRTLEEVKSPNGVDLSSKIDELTANLEQTRANVEIYGKKLYENLEISKVVSKEFDGVKEGLEKIKNEILETTKQSEMYLKSQKEALESISKFEEIMKKIENVDFKNYESKLERYTYNLQLLNDKIENGLQEKIDKNLGEIEKFEKKINEISENTTKQNNAITEIAKSVATMTTLLSKLTKTGNVDEQYIYEIIDRWADESKVKHKKR